MLSKSAARKFFLLGTAVCSGAFLLLTLDTLQRVPTLTREENLTEQVARGKHLWDRNNCMGCHTLLGEGAYYAPELTKVYERRGPNFIRAMIKDPEAMYPGERKMVKYDFSDEDIDALVQFFKWIGEIDLQGWPPKPNLVQVANSSVQASVGAEAVVAVSNRPKVFNQMCVACHTLQGQGGSVGPALDGVGDRKTRQEIARWLQDPQAEKADAKMPKLPLSETDLLELAAYLSELKSGGSKP